MSNKPCDYCDGSGYIYPADSVKYKCAHCGSNEFSGVFGLLAFFSIILAAVMPLVIAGNLAMNQSYIFASLLSNISWGWVAYMIKIFIWVGIVIIIGIYYWLFRWFYKSTLLVMVAGFGLVYLNWKQDIYIRSLWAVAGIK